MGEPDAAEAGAGSCFWVHAECRRGHTEGMQEPPQAIWGAAISSHGTARQPSGAGQGAGGHSAYLKSQLRLRNPRGGGRPESKLWGFLMPRSKHKW